MNVTPPETSPLVLIVDDFDDAREMYREYFAFMGYRVETAESGEEGLRLARAETPALILMDIEMRGMSGSDALRLLRADASLTDVPVVAFTAHALEHERVEQMVEGFDAVISKPCLPDELIALIEPYLAKHRLAN